MKGENTLKGFVKIPNWLINDISMCDSTKKVLFTLIACTGPRGSVCKSQNEIAQISGFCRNTVSKAIQSLTAHGFLLSAKGYRYSKKFGRMIRASSRYYVIGCKNCLGGYTLVPRCILDENLTPAAFTSALHVYRLSGRKGRCWPSLRRFAKLSNHAKSTICRAIRSLCSCQAIARLRCKKVNHAYSCNSYYPVAWVRKMASVIFSGNGGRKNEQLLSKKKDNEGFYPYRIEKGVFQFGILHNFSTGRHSENPFWFDGTGVKVCAPEEQDLLS